MVFKVFDVTLDSYNFIHFCSFELFLIKFFSLITFIIT
nr:MAG TPA: hypothetical protein [Caudoviricetes sp.]